MLDIPAETYDLTAPGVGVVVLSNSHWTDFQYSFDDGIANPELELNPIIFAGGQFQVDLWCAGGSQDGEVFGIGQMPTSLNYVPVCTSFNVCDEVDPVGNGDPDDIVPSCVPNYFLRDYGREERSVTQNHVQESPWARTPRVLHRHFGTLDAGKINAQFIDAASGDLSLGSGWRKTHSFRVKRHLLTRRQALYIFVRAYNSAMNGGPSNQNIVRLGIQVAGHFGYRRIVQR